MRRLVALSASVAVALVALLAGTVSPSVRGQTASPVASPAATAGTVVARGLVNPRAFVWGPDGTLYVAEAGSGGTTAATETAPTTKAIGPFHGGLTALVSKIVQGCPVPVATGLPSTLDAMGEALGAEDVAFLGGKFYVSADGGGPVHGNPFAASGIYRVNADGSTALVADLSTWLRAHPVAHQPADYDPDSDGYRMVADEKAGVLWVLEPNVGGVLTVKPDGTVTRVADLSEGHPVPASLALDPKGGVYIGNLTAVPFADGTAKVIHVAPDGTVTTVWTGLTVVTGVAVGADGSLYALEMSTGNLTKPPFLVPGSGKVVHQTGPSSSETIASGLMLPISLAFGPDGALYVSQPAIGANGGQGVILRLGGSGGGTPTVPASPAAPPAACPAGTPTA